MPSACRQDRRCLERAARGGRALARGVVLLGAVLLLLVAAAYIAITSGPGVERLRSEAEIALRGLAGEEIDVNSGPGRLSLDGSQLLGLQIADIRLTTQASGSPFLSAGSLRFGLQLWPLLTGNVQLRSLEIAQARIVPALAPRARFEADDWTMAFKNADGLIDPDQVGPALFAAAHRLFDLFQSRATRTIRLDDVDLVLDPSDRSAALAVSSAEITQLEPDTLALSATLAVNGQPVVLTGTAERRGDRDRIGELVLSATLPDLSAGRNEDGSPLLRGDVEIALSGEEGASGRPDRLTARAALREGAVRVGRHTVFAGQVDLAMSLQEGSGKVEIERLSLSSERSRMQFHGAVGPMPRSDGQSQRAYRYELVSDGSRIASDDVPDPALDFVAKVYGTYLPEERRLHAAEIGLRTSQGEAIGTASVGFLGTGAPSLVLAIDIPSLPVAHAKQLWPWLSAPGARRWTLQNVFGGTVKDGWLRLSVPSGRLGNGIPLARHEVSGSFRIDDTRFDIAGDLPPVRDAYGTVEFQGTDVDIALSSGTVFMASGRTVAAREGTFVIRDAHVRPVIGKLEIDVEGDAPAVIELASYPPIEAMKKLTLEPADFTGRTSGHVRSDIPLSRDVPAGALRWLVSLDYDELSIAKPLDGQMITDASGTIVIDPERAVIKAGATLNGLPATLDLVEPLDEDPALRRRAIVLTLDEQAREKLAPGLNTILSGPVSVDFRSGESAVQTVRADLTGATLKLPWLGWSKGPGVPATASFEVIGDGERTQLSAFRLEGRSFGAQGRIVLDNGTLSSLYFEEARLTRGDLLSVELERSGKGYVIGLTGKTFDTRTLIKQLQADTAGQAAGGSATHLAIDAQIANVVGFSGETLNNVRLSYEGTGARTDRLVLSAVSRSGGAISANDTGSGNARVVQMQSADAGALLRFLNVYEHMEGGSIRLVLNGQSEDRLAGHIAARDFWIVDEPRLRSIVSSAPAGDGRSLNQAVRRDIDTSRVHFERGFARIEKGRGYLAIGEGVLRGPLIGTTFRGTLYDQQGNMSIAGTFMPAYGLNRLFAEIPIIGQILGNGRDRGLIGLTYRLAGDAKAPRLQVNPISVIAPGIFRSIFEFD